MVPNLNRASTRASVQALTEVVRDGYRWCYWFPWRRLVQAMSIPARLAAARSLGSLYYFSSPGWRALSKAEILASFQEPPASQAISRLSLRGARQYFQTQLEVFAYPCLTPAEMEKYFPINGRQNLDAALNQGRGVLILLSHLGANQMIMPALGFRGYRIHQISRAAQAGNDEYLGRRLSPCLLKVIELQRSFEESLPAQHIDVSRGLRPVLRQLKANGVVAVAGDGRYGSDWTPHRFLGRPATFSPGPWLIAHRTGAPLLFTFVLRPYRGSTYQVIIEPPLPLPYGAGAKEFLAAGLEVYTRRLEEYFSRYPCQYLPFLYLARRYTQGRDNQFFLDYASGGQGAYGTMGKSAVTAP
jgi:phosphatidylinositol dimannoside acyltransferase